ncbi:Ivy family c-type lysozyme inhibitor [Burkholderia latens]|uniref:Ivy family c-type lysozyme inhibitor n=1 Tax=Burkholderia latens TaxID=488446 RepID=UPI003C7E91EE
MLCPSRTVACALALLSTLFGSPSNAGAGSVLPVFSVLVNEAPYHEAWQHMFAGEAQVPQWLAQGDSTSSPGIRRYSNGVAYVTGSMCKRHDCADNEFFGMFDEHAQHAWGVLVTATPSALTTQNGATDAQSLRVRWFGHPDRSTRMTMLAFWKTGPQWPSCVIDCGKTPRAFDRTARLHSMAWISAAASAVSGVRGRDASGIAL